MMDFEGKIWRKFQTLPQGVVPDRWPQYDDGMKKYFRVFLGSGGEHIKECVEKGFIGVDYGFMTSLSPYLAETWSESRGQIKPVYLKFNPEKSPVGAGLSCGALWTFGKGMQRGDLIFCPDGNGNYFSGEVTGDYMYVEDSFFPHQRGVAWQKATFSRSDMSEDLKRSTGATLTIIEVTKFAEEIETLTGGQSKQTIFASDVTVEDPSAFALEKHLEDFLVYNWPQTELAKKYDLVTDEGVIVAQQYASDTGPIDILAISKDKKEYLVVELKKGRTSDVVVGQTLRYMGFVKNDLAVNGENVRGAVIALEDDLRLRNALSMVPSIDFYRYQIDFKLNPVVTG
jgi:restriction system protein